MKILIISDPFNSFNIIKDTTYSIIIEMNSRNYSLYHCLSEDISVKNNLVIANSSKINLLEKNNNWFELSNKEFINLKNFNAVLIRSNPPFNMQYLYLTYILSLAENTGVKIFNSAQGIRDLNEKLSILNFTDFIPPTIISTKLQDIKYFLNEHDDIIIKPLDSMGGAGIFRLTSNDYNFNSILETIMCNDTKTIMAQKYISQILEGDKRVILINGTPIDYALARIPIKGEVRANLAAGGKAKIIDLNDNDRNIAINIGKKLKKRGIFFAGLDIIGNYLTEINVTSPTGFQEISKQTKFNVAKYFVDNLESSL